jgi:hypothetical protein
MLIAPSVWGKSEILAAWLVAIDSIAATTTPASTHFCDKQLMEVPQLGSAV